MAELDIKLRLKQGDKVIAGIEKINKSLKNIQAQPGVKKVNDQLRKLNTQAVKSSTALTFLKSRIAPLVAGFGALRIVSGITSNFLDFESALAEVRTILPDTVKGNDELTKSLIDASSAFGTTAAQQAKSFYQIISAGITDVVQANDVLIQSNKLAIGGLTETANAVRIITTALNVYGRNVLTAKDVSDSLFLTVRLGVTRVENLAASLGLVLPQAKQVGVSFDEINAALTILTKRGVSTSIAVTQLSAIFTAILRKGALARKEFGTKVAKAFSVTALRTKGLTKFLVDLTDALGGSEEKLVKLLGRVEGVKAILTLGSDGFRELTETNVQFQNKLEETGNAVKIVNETFGRQAKILGTNLLNSTLNAAEAIANKLTPALKGLNAAFLESKTAEEVISLIDLKLAINDIVDVISAGFAPMVFLNIEDDLDELESLVTKGVSAAKEIDDAFAEKFREKKFKLELEAVVKPIILSAGIEEQLVALQKALKNAGKTQRKILTEQLKDRLFLVKAAEEELGKSTKRTSDLRIKALADFNQKIKVLDEKAAKERETAARNAAQAEELRQKELERIFKKSSSNIFDGIREALDQPIGTEKFQNAISGLFSGVFSNLAKGAAGAKDAVIGVVKGIGASFGPIGVAIGEIVGFLAEGPEKVREMVQEFFKAIPDIIAGIIEAIPVLIEELALQLPIIVEKLAEILPPAIEKAVLALIEAAPRIINALVIRIPAIAIRFAIALAAQAPFIALKITAAMIAEQPKIAKEFVKSLIEEMKKSISEVFDSIGGIFGGGGGEGGGGRGAVSNIAAVATGGISKAFGFADGGTVPGNAPFTDRVNAALTPGEVVIPRANGNSVKDSIVNQQRLQAENNQLLKQLIDAAGSGDSPQNLSIQLQIGQQQLADVLLDLNRQGFRVA